MPGLRLALELIGRSFHRVRRPMLRPMVMLLPLLVAACQLDKLVTSSENPPGSPSVQAARLEFTVQPGVAPAGAAITPAIEVTAQNQAGEKVSGYTGAVTVSLAANPSGATLSGTTTVNAVAGVARFDNISISMPGEGYQLSATADGPAAAMSDAFKVKDRASRMDMESGNSQTDTVGATLAKPLVVRVTDADGIEVSGVTVTWAVTGGGSITPTSVTDAEGDAAATRVLGTTAGTQNVTATVDGLVGSPVSFAAMARPASPKKLAFTVQPTNTAAGSAITPSVQVSAQDQFGNTASSFNGIIGLTIKDSPRSDAVLSGATIRVASNGVANFPGMSIAQRGDRYTLAAGAINLESATSDKFDIKGAGSGHKISLASGDNQSDTVAATLKSPYAVLVTDDFGNTESGVTVTWTVTTGGGSISTSSITDVNGTATATRILGITAGIQQATASVSGYSGSPVAFTATAQPGSPRRLAFLVEPTSATAGYAIDPPVTLAAQDQFSNTATSFSGVVSVSLVGNAGALLGVTSKNAFAGVATFYGLGVSQPGTGYQLSASATGISGATSAAFDIRPGSPTTLTVISGNGQSDTVAATLASPYRVRVSDAIGSGLSGVTVSWAVTGGGGSVTPSSSTTDANGFAATTHTLGTQAGPQTVSASVTGLNSVTFTSTARPGAVATLAFTGQPTGAAAGATLVPAVQLTLKDRFGNLAGGASTIVSLSITPLTGTPGATLSGTLNHTPTAGIVSYQDLRINLPGVSYRLRAQVGTVLTDSAPFNITP